MAIFKNFPSVSKLVAENIMDKQEANLAYKINRADMTVAQMIETVEAAGLASVTSCMDAWLKSMHTYPTKRQAFKELLNFMADGMCGVEFMGVHRRHKYGVEYLNAGDSYTATLIFHNHHDGTVRIGCVGDSINQVTTEVLL